MATPQQIEANRANALMSTGPRTAAGKARASRNARKHGLLSREVVAETERRRDFEAFREALEAHVQPVGTLEAVLLDRVVCCAWRLRRAMHIEAELFARVVHRRLEETEDGEDLQEIETVSASLADALKERGHTLEKVGRYERAIEASLFRALHELQRLQAARHGAPVSVPAALDVSVEVAEATRGEP